MDNKYLDIISGSGGGCFLEDTKVLTPSGLKNIIDIEEGDEVIAFDDKGNLHTSIVLSTNSHENKEVYRYTLWGGSYIDATPNHWVLNADNSFIEIGKVDESIALVNASGFLTPIVSKKYLGNFKVYNLIVDKYHTYIANGLRVHNGGGGKSGSTHIPSESPDTLHSKTYAKVLDLLCEGEIEGLVNGAQSIYFDSTPLMNSDGSYNYSDVSWQFRTGTQNQDPIEGFNDIEAEHAENVKIQKAIPKVISVTDPTVDKVRLALSIPALYQQETDGDLVGATLSYAVSIQKNGADGTGTTAEVGTIDSGVITSVPITNGGSGYPTATTTISITGAGTSASITPIINNGVIKSITVVSGGNGYTSSNTTVKIIGNGTGAVVMPVIEDWYLSGEYAEAGSSITRIDVLNGGSGYTSATVSITTTDVLSATAAATANISNGVITGLNIVNGGKNYTTATTFTAVGSGGSGATFGTPIIASGVIKSINLLTQGIGYVNPAVIIRDINNIAFGASAIASINTAGAVTAVSVVSGGSGYTTSGTSVTIASGGFEPVTLTDIPAAVIGYTEGGFSFSSSCKSLRGLAVLANPTVIKSLTPPYIKVSVDGVNSSGEYAVMYRPYASTTAFTTLAQGSLSFDSGARFFMLEEVYKAYNDLKATNPTIELTYEAYIESRLRNQSPAAPESVIAKAIILSKLHGYTIPMPYAYFDIELTTAANWYFNLQFRVLTTATFAPSYKVGFFEVQAENTGTIATISGKTTSKYIINHVIELPRTSETDEFDIRIERISPDSTLSTLQNDLYFESYATIVSALLRYPNSALFGISIDSQNFSTIPTRGYHLKLLKIKIPSNYDPITGLYNRASNGTLVYDGSGNPVEQLWTGDFYTAWSNNPAWCFYDLVTNDRYGLGEYIDPSMMDEYTLYSIGKYCDERIPDGFGGTERRFTLNTYIQTREDAIKILQNIASVFRGMVYWNSGLLSAVNDGGNSTPVYQFTNANVVEGTFNYSGASRKVAYNAVLVSWNDPQLQYKQRIEYVEDRESIDKYGYNPTEVIAFGCTSRGQAYRQGKAILYTNLVENNIVTFKAALDASYIRPGLLVSIRDEIRVSGNTGNMLAGRIVSKAGSTLTLDRNVTWDGTPYRVRLNSYNTTLDPNKNFLDALKTEDYATQTWPANTTNNSIVLMNDARSSYVTPSSEVTTGSIWIARPESLNEEIYRVLAIKETEDIGIYEITGILHNPSKYDYIENNLELENYSYTNLDNLPYPATFATPVANPDYPASSSMPYISAPLMSGIYVTSSGTIESYLSISFNPGIYAVKYDIYLKKDSDDWQKIAVDLTRPSHTIYGTKDGAYYRVKVVSKNFAGVESAPAIYPPLTEQAYLALGKLAPPTPVSSITATINDAKTGINISWSPVTDLDLKDYEVKYGSDTTSWETATSIIFTNSTSLLNYKALLAGDFKFFVKPRDTSLIYSLNAAETGLTVDLPSIPTLSAAPSIEGTGVKISWNDSTTTFAIKHYIIYLGGTSNSNIAAYVPGTSSFIVIPITWSSDINLYIRAVDLAGNTSDFSSPTVLSFSAPSITDVTVRPITTAEYVMDLVISNNDLPLSYVITKFGGSSWETATTLSTSTSTTVIAPINYAAGTSRVYRFKAYDTANRASNEYTKILTVTAPATPSIAAPVFENIDNTIKLSWQDCKTTLPINYYEIREGGTNWATGVSIQKVYGLEVILPVTWTTSSTYRVLPFDINGNTATSAGSIAATATAWGAVSLQSPAYNIVDSNCLLLWNKPAVEGSFSLSHYNIYLSTTASASIATSTTESVSIPITWTGNRVFVIAAVDSKGNIGAAANITASISLPVAPVIDSSGCGFLLDQFTIKWFSVPQTNTTVSIQEYEVGYYTNYGATNQGEVSLGKVKGTVFSSKADWGGSRVFWVKSIDILGNVGTSKNEVELDVIVPGAINTSDMVVQVVDNNVLLYWKEPSLGTLPVLTYEIREGDSWNDVNVRYIGVKTGNFTTIFETVSGDFKYWITAIDTAGNYGTPAFVTTTVNQPPDYILKADEYTDFSGTKSNAYLDGTALLMPVNTTETWAQHFTNRNWTTIQNQIDDGFEIYIEPGAVTSYYEETIDYLTILAANKITITPSSTVLAGSPQVTCDIYTSTDNSTWTPATNSWSTYATNFRYMKYRITANGAKNATYTQSGTTATITCSSHGLITSDSVFVDFTSGGASNTDDNTYTVTVIDENSFRVVLPNSRTVSPAQNAIIYSDKFSGVIKLNKVNIRLDSKLKTLTGTVHTRPPKTSATYSHSGYLLYVTHASHEALAGDIVELDYNLTGATYTQTGTSVVVSKASHGFITGEKVILDFTSGSAGIPSEDYFTITGYSSGNFTVTSTQSIANTTGNVSIRQPFKVDSVAGNVLTITNLVSKTTSGSTGIDPVGTCVFLTVDRTSNTEREYIDVDAISLTANSITPIIPVYDLSDKPNPWFFRVLTFTTAGAATSVASCSYTVRGF